MRSKPPGGRRPTVENLERVAIGFALSGIACCFIGLALMVFAGFKKGMF